MGMTEFRESLAPRRKMNKSFFPFRPMVPSASARFMMNGMSDCVARAPPRPIFVERSRKPRRVMRLGLCIALLFLKALQREQHRDAAADSRFVRGRIAGLR